MRKVSSLLAVASLGAAAVAAVSLAAPAAAAAPAAGTYVPVNPFRAVDTRTGALSNHKGAVAFNHGITPRIGGHGGVPVKVAAVAVTITAVSPSAAGGVVAYEAGTSRPGVENVLYPKGRNTAVFAIVRASSTGRISLFNVARSGSTQLIVDVAGYYVAGTPSAANPGVLHTVTPSRRLDTRTGSGAVGAGKTTTAAIGGHGGVPASGVGAVMVMISAVTPAKSGALIGYATGATRPSESTVHFVAGVSYTEFAVVTADSLGRITIYNSSPGGVQVVVDVVGYTTAGVVTTAGALQPLSPSRVVTASSIAANASRSVPVAGKGGVPLKNVSAVVVTITVAASTRSGSVIAWKAGTPVPGVTNLQYAAGQMISDVAIVPVSSSGTIAVRNASGGSAKLYVDIDGYVPSNTITPLATSTSRYLGDLSENVSNDEATMATHGCDDAAAGPTLVLLDVGAQSITGPELSSANPGVALALADPVVRLDYADLRTVIDSYLNSFSICMPGGLTPTIAVGTNNSGAFDGPNAYPAATRGTDWATQVVAQLAGMAPTGISVVGANDIENGNPDTDGFDNDVTNAQDWETAYLAATTGTLVYNGSANGCSTTFGATGGTCQDGWTMAQLYGLAHNSDRIQVLPQVFYATQAVQWANIDATGGRQLQFIGSLTEHALDPTTYLPAQGRAALVRALSSVVAAPAVPAATDLRNG